MKKIILVALAAVGLAACATEDTIVTPKGNAIAFGDAFVDNATKAIIGSANDIQGFTVWGNVQGTNLVALYGDSGASVTRDSKNLGVAWNCSETRYWTPSCTFNFTAIANGRGKTITNGIPTEIEYTATPADPSDLIYGVATATTDASSVPTGDVVDVTAPATASVVKFTMNHLLSRVKVSFANALDAEATDYRYVISNVKVVSAGSGTYTIANNSWTLGNDVDFAYSTKTYPLTLTAAATTDCGAQLVIPTSPVDLVFTYALELKTGTDTWTAINTATVTKENIIASPVKNYSYNVTVELKAGAKIDFTVNATNGLVDYTNGGDITIQ